MKASATTAQRPALRGSTYFLYPGQVRASQGEGTITTILGTCVAVCLWDGQARVGGVNHYLLAKAPAGESSSPRFGLAAIPLLLEEMLSLGACKPQLVAKVFGGMSSQMRGIGTSDIGATNVALAQETLEALRIPLLTCDVGGARGRKLVFDIATGNAWVKQL